MMPRGYGLDTGRSRPDNRWDGAPFLEDDMSSPTSFAVLAEAARRSPPQVALVLGSGMSNVLRDLRVECAVPFGDIPGLTATSVVGHSGTLTLADWAGKRVLVFGGRLHFYEGHPWEAVVRPIEVAAALGISALFLTNAAGGIHDACNPGGFMAITDHLEWTRPYCWRQPGPGGVGPDRPSPYASRLVKLLVQTGADLGVPVQQGIYAALTGPSYETPSEIRALKTWGADAVGMSTAREIQRGADLGLECGALSLITNKAAGLSAAPLDHKDVLITAKAQEETLATLLEAFVRRM